MNALKAVASATADYLFVLRGIVKAYPADYKFPAFVFV